MTCGGGLQRQIKTCTNPSPKHGGKQCPGSQPSRNVRCKYVSTRTAKWLSPFLLLVLTLPLCLEWHLNRFKLGPVQGSDWLKASALH